MTHISTSTPTARKLHFCDACTCPIWEGAKYVREGHVDEGRAFAMKFHPDCLRVLELWPDYYDPDGWDPVLAYESAVEHLCDMVRT